MGYDLKAFIGKSADLERIEVKIKKALAVSMTNELSLIPMTEHLFNEINKYRRNNEVGKYEHLTTDVEDDILEIIGNRMIAYVEVEYFGGEGAQDGIIWKEG